MGGPVQNDGMRGGEILRNEACIQYAAITKDKAQYRKSVFQRPDKEFLRPRVTSGENPQRKRLPPPWDRRLVSFSFTPAITGHEPRVTSLFIKTNSSRLVKKDELHGARTLRNDSYIQYAALTNHEMQCRKSRFSTAC